MHVNNKHTKKEIIKINSFIDFILFSFFCKLVIINRSLARGSTRGVNPYWGIQFLSGIVILAHFHWHSLGLKIHLLSLKKVMARPDTNWGHLHTNPEFPQMEVRPDRSRPVWFDL